MAKTDPRWSSRPQPETRRRSFHAEH
jgi:hypothetical protein